MKKEWREIVGRIGEFQVITGMLVDFDERTARFELYSNAESHYLRKVVTICQAQHLRLFVRDEGSYLYTIVVEMRSPSGYIVATWVHEDGVQIERENFSDEPNHPVHGILCLTDLLQSGTENVEEKELAEPVVYFMNTEEPSEEEGKPSA